jgi:apolipoprotein N-acyltransferase
MTKILNNKFIQTTLIPVILGSLSYFVFAPYFYTPLILIIIGGLLQTIWTSKSNGFLIGFFFGIGHFISTLYWIVISVKTAGMDEIAVIGMLAICSYLSLYYAIVALLLKKYKKDKTSKIEFSLIATVALMSAQFMQGHLFTGFPWNLWGYGFSHEYGIIQLTSFIGIYGLTFLTILLSCLVWSGYLYKKPYFGISTILICLSLFFISNERVDKDYCKKNHYEKINIVIVQPCIDQKIKWSRSYFMDSLHCLLNLTKSSKRGIGENIIIWPEAAIPSFVEEDSHLCEYISSYINKNDTVFFGAPRRKENKIFTSIFSLSKSGKCSHLYDKSHLVPFGEYLPFRSILSFFGLNKLTHGLKDYSEGNGKNYKNYKKNIPEFKSKICYEIIFPFSNSIEKENYKWILNITNDSWFGDSTAPHQHFHIARVRAIEQGKSVVRIANNGISAVIDPFGTVIRKTEFNKKTSITTILPKPIKNTFYALYGNISMYIMLALCFIIGIIIRFRR